MKPSSVSHPDGGGFTSCQHLPTTELRYTVVTEMFLGVYNSTVYIYNWRLKKNIDSYRNL